MKNKIWGWKPKRAGIKDLTNVDAQAQIHIYAQDTYWQKKRERESRNVHVRVSEFQQGHLNTHKPTKYLGTILSKEFILNTSTSRIFEEEGEYRKD